MQQSHSLKHAVWARSILSLSLLAPAFSLCATELRIDHVTIAGRDLKKMQTALAEAGFPSEYGGPHANRATEMAIVSFPDGSYLELIGIQPNADPQAVKQHPWGRYLESEMGRPCAWAIRSVNVDSEVQRLSALGVEVKSPVRSGRTRPDGYRLDWQTAQVGGDGNGTFFPFLIRDSTPRNKRAFPSGKPVNLDYPGISSVVIAVSDLDQSIGRYRQAFGLPEPLRGQDRGYNAKWAWFQGTPVILENSSGERDFQPHVSAVILKKTRGSPPADSPASEWFGQKIQWLHSDRLGWRLGIE